MRTFWPLFLKQSTRCLCSSPPGPALLSPLLFLETCVRSRSRCPHSSRSQRAPCSPVLSRGRGPATAPSTGTGRGDAAPLPSSPPPETHSQTPRDVTYTWTLVKNRPREPTNRNESRLLDTEETDAARGEASGRRRSQGGEVGGANAQLPREHPRNTHGTPTEPAPSTGRQPATA